MATHGFESNSMVSVKGFSKSFGHLKAVDDLSFDVARGEIFAFLGSNGSGKTTTIRCLLGILSPDDGTLLIDGKKYNQTRSSILGYLPEERGLYAESKVLETLSYFAVLRGLTASEAQKKASAFLERVGLIEKQDSQIKKLSSGQQQKIQLGVAIINDPELLILDEPTRGLDPVNRSLLMDMVKDLNENGSTVIYTSHLMEDIEKIADRLVLIDEGRRVLYGNLDEVKRKFGTNTIHVWYSGKIPENPKLCTMKAEKNEAEITPIEGVETEDILKYLISEDVAIRKFEVGTPSLEQIFINVVGKKIEKNEKS